jgi:hypothetical protein
MYAKFPTILIEGLGDILPFIKHLRAQRRNVDEKWRSAVKIAAAVFAASAYQASIIARGAPFLISRFSAGTAAIILLFFSGGIFFTGCFACLLCMIEFRESDELRLLKALGFSRTDEMLLMLWKALPASIIAGILITATRIVYFDASMMLRYVSQPAAFAAVALAFAYPVSIIAASRPARFRRKAFAFKALFKGKFWSGFYKDFLLLRSSPEFIAAAAFELALIVLFAFLIKFEQLICFVFLYGIIWFGAMTTESLYSKDIKYALFMKHLYKSKSEYFFMKALEAMLLQSVPALLFMLVSLLKGMPLESAAFGAALSACLIVCLSFGGSAICSRYYPDVKKKSMPFLMIYYIVSLFPPLAPIAAAAAVISFRRAAKC